MPDHLFSLDLSVADKIVRTVLVYAALAVLLRLAGKRELAQLNSFDLVVVLLLSNVVQNAVIGPDNSLSGGLLGAAVLVGVNAVVVRAAARSKTLTTVFEGTPTTLVQDGHYLDRALGREGLRRADIEGALRKQNANDVSEAERVVLAPGGTMVVTLRPEERDATHGDIEGLRARIEQLESRLLTALGSPGAPSR